MKSFVVGKNDAGQRMDRFISKAAPALPAALMHKYIRKKYIKLDRKRCEAGTRLVEGNVVDMYIPDEFFVQKEPEYDFLHASKNLNIVYEDDNIILIDKPQGLLVHPDDREYRDTLIARIQRYLYEKGEFDPAKENSFRPALANRIDRNTGGIVIAAKNAEALRILCEKIKSRELCKKYLAVVHGTPKKREDTLTDYLLKDAENNQVYIKNHARDGAAQSITHYKVIKSKNNLSLLDITILTGRTHQIRAQMAAAGHPLLGDGKYGKTGDAKSIGYKRQALYSYLLGFEFKTPAGQLDYLNGRVFKVKECWFAKELFDYEITN